MSDGVLSEGNSSNRLIFNRTTAQGEWRRRLARAEELRGQYGFAAEILRFYAAILLFQNTLSADMVGGAAAESQRDGEAFGRPLAPGLENRFGQFLAIVEQSGPTSLQEAARELRRNDGSDAHLQLLRAFWAGDESEALSLGAADFFARAFLQPHAAQIRARSIMRWSGPAPYFCPLCKRKPVCGVLRPLGDGGQRSLVCSFCLAEWEFRRLVCPGCGEEDQAKLAVYSAEELKHVRVEACDSCRIYIKTIDMTKNGLAEPVVDEIAAVPLDVWAQEHGYTKLQPNLMQL
jgi:formate dehydrogenase accessory protein FdhE